MAAVCGRPVDPRRLEHGVGRLDGDQRLGQPVADRLEPGDGLTELDAVEGVLAGQLEHAPRRAHQLVAEGELPERDRRRASRPVPTSRAPSTSPRHLDQSERRVDARRSGAAGATPSSTSSGDVRVAVRGHDQAVALASARRSRGRRRRAGRRRAVPAAPPIADRRAARTARRPRRPARRRARWSSADDVAFAAPWSANSSDTAARGSADEGVAASRARRARRRARRRCGCPVACAEAALEQLEVGAVHQRSLPRSSRRRAMMLRWISALPP